MRDERNVMRCDEMRCEGFDEMLYGVRDVMICYPVPFHSMSHMCDYYTLRSA